MKRESEWIRCPVCGNKTRDKIREDTILKNYPLYCPKCRQELSVKQKQIEKDEKRIRELDRLFRKIYEDNVNGKLSDERFCGQNHSP